MKKTSNETIGNFPKTKEIFSKDKITGELQNLGEIEIKTKDKKVNTSFYMVWLQEINPKDLKTKFLHFIIKNNRKGILIATNKFLAQKFECTEKTIQTLKHTMKEEGYIKYKPRYILLNPNFIWIGSATSREKAEEQYRALEEKDS